MDTASPHAVKSLCQEGPAFPQPHWQTGGSRIPVPSSRDKGGSDPAASTVIRMPGPLRHRIECGNPPTTMKGVIPRDREGRH